MRYYGFANFMLSSIQQGVQNFHVLGEMFNEYPCSDTAAERMLVNWSMNHKTAIFLNGGNAQGLRDVYGKLVEFGDALNLPVAKFHEDEDSLDGAMTACGIIVPTLVVDIALLVPSEAKYNYCVTDDVVEEVRNTCYCLGSNDEIKLAMFLNNFSLAR